MSEHKYAPRSGIKSFPKLAYTCAGSDITFIAIGNAGIPRSRESHPIPHQITADVVSVIEERQAQFVVYLGNSFSDGVKDVDDTRWETEWAERFEVEKIDIPFFAVNGNLEYKKNVTATGCYSEQGRHKKYWILPDSAYSLNVGTMMGSLQPAFTMFFIDTEVSKPEYTDHNGQADDNTLNVQGMSIEKYRKDRMIFLVGHRPIHSTLQDTPEASLHDRRTPEVEMTKLSKMTYDTYISGHLLGMEYIQDDSLRDRFVIGGGGGEPYRLIEAIVEEGKDTQRSESGNLFWSCCIQIRLRKGDGGSHILLLRKEEWGVCASS